MLQAFIAEAFVDAPEEEVLTQAALQALGGLL
jgi:Fe-S cluster assembly protein SufD